jgi:hypothetical protein
MTALAEGSVQIPIDRTIPLEQVDDAFRLLADRAVTGKIVLVLVLVLDLDLDLDLGQGSGRATGLSSGTGGSPS